jgi:hypothetical protein
VIDDEEPNQAQVRAWQERRELLRQANARIVENHETGRRIADPLTLHHAKMFLNMNPPLAGQLGTGEPSTKDAP